MKQKHCLTIAILLMIGGCDQQAQKENAGPKADHPFTPPALDKNPAMSSAEIDKINQEMKDAK